MKTIMPGAEQDILNLLNKMDQVADKMGFSARDMVCKRILRDPSLLTRICEGKATPATMAKIMGKLDKVLNGI